MVSPCRRRHGREIRRSARPISRQYRCRAAFRAAPRRAACAQRGGARRYRRLSADSDRWLSRGLLKRAPAGLWLMQHCAGTRSGATNNAMLFLAGGRQPMRTLIIAIAVTATVALGGALAWQARAAAPASPVPAAGPYTAVHPAACNGTYEAC